MAIAMPLVSRIRARLGRRDACEKCLPGASAFEEDASTITRIGPAYDQALLDEMIEHAADRRLRDSQSGRKPSDRVVLIEQIAGEKHRELPDRERVAVLIGEAGQDSVEAHEVHIRGTIVGNHEVSPMCQDAGWSACVQNPDWLSARADVLARECPREPCRMATGGASALNGPT